MAQGTTISEMLQNLADSKAAITAALTAKGVTVPSGAKFEDIAALVEQVEGGGSSEVTDISAYLPAWEADRNTMTRLVIPEGVTKIGYLAFYDCYSMKSLTLPGTLKSINSSAFLNCNSLTSLVIPEGVTSISEFAFSGCISLTSMSFPSTIMSIGDNSFNQCPSICDIQFAKTKAEVSAMNRYLWGISAGAVIHCTDGDLTV